MPTSHTSLPPPYNASLTPDVLTRYGAVLPARQADALRLRWAGFLYAQIGFRLGVTAGRARELVRQACERLSHAKQQADAQTPDEDRHDDPRHHDHQDHDPRALHRNGRQR